MIEYTYNLLNQVIRFKDKDGVITDYQYNGAGHRVSKSTNGERTNFYWDRGYIANEGNGTDISATNYIGGNGVFARKEGNDIHYMFKDGHGNVTSLVKGGAVTRTYDYDAYGTQKDIDPGDTNPFRYCGEYYDSETQNIYLRNRYYNSSIGRFTTEDPVKAGMNWYGYCAGNPVMFVDRSGLKPGDVFDSLDEAALDAGDYYMAITIVNDEEMCGLFYQNADGKFTYYDVENTAENKTLGFEVSWDWSDDPTKNPIAFIHSHVFHDINNPNNEFSTPGNTTGSGDDATFAANNGIPIFLVAPTGEVKKYDPSTTSTSLVGNIRVDPKYETARWYQNTLIWNLLDKQYPEIAKMDIIKAKVKHPDSLYDMLKTLGVIN